ncbi:MAG: DUF2019 domain-containing protein [Clostridia bacterium]|nr:DUF2019 domain-containing protein [Clostridia bacterium]
MDLIFEYVTLVIKMDETDYADKKSIRQHNRLADRIRAMACEIDHMNPKIKRSFYELLSHENETVRIWVAHHILEVMNYDNMCRGKALKIISCVADKNDRINSFGNKMWLEKWLQEHPLDRELL